MLNFDADKKADR